MQQHTAFTAEVEEAGGKILGGEALQPSSTATYLRGTRGDVTVVDNPAPDLKEILGGYYLVEANDDDHARGSPDAARRRTATSRSDRSGRSRPSMPDDAAAAAAADAQRLYWGRVLAATLRMARDVDIAEEATADAFALALQTWPDRGVPDSVEAWLLTAARRRAIDRIRRLARFRERLAAIAATGDLTAQPADALVDAPPVLDDELRLVVLCCHPALAQEVQVALTMRLGCGVPTASVAAAFLVPEATMAARLTRAKKRIAESGVGIELPDDVAVEERMPAVRRTIHLAYTMGHTAGSGATLRHDDIADHAVRLARTLHALRPDDSEATGLLALIAAHRGPRRHAFDDGGDQVLLADADRTRWDAR